MGAGGQSILAKHLVFQTPVNCYDLKTEAGRQSFLEQRYHLLVTVTLSRHEAREMEKLKDEAVHISTWESRRRLAFTDDTCQ